MTENLNPPSRNQLVQERIRVAITTLHKMACSIPEGHGSAPKTVIGPLARAHEEMVKELCAFAAKWFNPLHTKISDHLLNPQDTRVINCAWGREPGHGDYYG